MSPLSISNENIGGGDFRTTYSPTFNHGKTIHVAHHVRAYNLRLVQNNNLILQRITG